MPSKITILEPCRQNWDSMLPNVEGRYCNRCTKTVINFTEMTDEQVQHYFIQHHKEAICGRFKNIQLHRIVIDLPQNIFSSPMPDWMKFLVACLIIFGISLFHFETTIAGIIPTETVFYQGESNTVIKEKKAGKLKRKKRRSHKIYFDIDVAISPITRETMGYTVSTPTLPIYTSIFVLPKDLNKESNSKILSKEDLEANTTPPEKKHPGPSPYIPAEFILPALIIGKRKISKTAMD